MSRAPELNRSMNRGTTARRCPSSSVIESIVRDTESSKGRITNRVDLFLCTILASASDSPSTRLLPGVVDSSPILRSISTSRCSMMCGLPAPAPTRTTIVPGGDCCTDASTRGIILHVSPASAEIIEPVVVLKVTGPFSVITIDTVLCGGILSSTSPLGPIKARVLVFARNTTNTPSPMVHEPSRY